jgi:hypothetical protein
MEKIYECFKKLISLKVEIIKLYEIGKQEISNQNYSLAGEINKEIREKYVQIREIQISYNSLVQTYKSDLIDFKEIDFVYSFEQLNFETIDDLKALLKRLEEIKVKSKELVEIESIVRILVSN